MVTKKMIEFGHAAPTLAYTHQNFNRMKDLPFDGVTARLNNGHRSVFTTRPYPDSDFEGEWKDADAIARLLRKK